MFEELRRTSRKPAVGWLRAVGTAVPLPALALFLACTGPTGCDTTTKPPDSQLLPPTGSGDTTGSGASSGTSGSGGSGGFASAGLSGCGIPCDDATPCTGNNMLCLPAAEGGTVCKPNTCPVCGSGEFCAYDDVTCEPTGCTSFACGFAYTGVCDACVQASCCNENLECADDPACTTMVACIAECGADANCSQACVGQSAAAASELNQALACDQSACSRECGTASTTSPSDAGVDDAGTMDASTTDAEPADAGTPGQCDFLTDCVAFTTQYSTLACAENGGTVATLTNHCNEAIYCELGLQTLIPPPLGTAAPAGSTGMAIQPEKGFSAQGCEGANDASFRCVPLDEAEDCLGVTMDAGTPPAATISRNGCARALVLQLTPDCLKALDTNCCAQESACANDTACAMCETFDGELVECSTDATLQALVSCQNSLGLVCEGGA